MKTALSIAGSDCSGGAGIQADLKTMTMNGVYAMSAITALTAQNTTGVRAILESTPEFLGQQIDAVFEDIYPDAVKIGMVSSAELIHVIAERLKYYGAKNVVVDPVMVSTSGSTLIKNDATKTMVDELFCLATVVTPNVPEAEVLADMRIESKEDMLEAEEVMWLSAQNAEQTITEVYAVAEESIIFVKEALSDIHEDMERISSYHMAIEQHNPGLTKDVSNILKWGKK